MESFLYSISLDNLSVLKTDLVVPVISLSVYLSAQVVSAEPFSLKTAQNKITTANMVNKAPIGLLSSVFALNYKLP